MTSELKNLTDGLLTLVPATITMLEAELAGDHLQVFNLLNLNAPHYWPPELNDADSYSHFLNVLKAAPGAKGWGAYYAIQTESAPALVGTGGFIAPPDNKGTVEIGYSILSQHRRQGLATRLSRLLVAKAFADDRVTSVIAHTYPHLIGSIGVLTKLDFQFDGERDDGTVAYCLNR